MSDNRITRRIFVSMGIALLIGAGLAACKSQALDEDYVQFVNGYDFAVTATVTDKAGKQQVFPIPAHGRVGKDFAGKQTVKVTLEGGAVLSDGKIKFGARDKRKERCLFFYNVLGSAAIINEEIVYGIGISPQVYSASGRITTKLCPTWGFETKKPPEAITTKNDSMGATLSWMHYVGDGTWRTSVARLLEGLQRTKRPEQSKFQAQRIVGAILTHFPEDENLPAMKTLFAQHKVDFPEDYREFGRLITKKRKGTKALKAGKWTVSDSKKVHMYAMPKAPVLNWLGHKESPLLVLRCIDGKATVVVQTGPCKMEIHGYDVDTSKCTVGLKFDKGEEQRILATGVSGKALLILPRPVTTIRKMLESETLEFRHTMTINGDQTITYDLRELDQVIWKLQQACNWNG